MHDANPYRDPPASFPEDPAFPYVGADWRDTTSVYGPAFTLASEPLALAARESADAAAWIYKALGALAVLTATGLAVWLAPRRSFACVFAGWNPLLALHFAGGGHNDAWMAALVLAALALSASGHRVWAGVAWAAAVLVKWVPLVFLPLRLLEARRTGRRLDHLGFAAAAGVVLVLASVPLRARLARGVRPTRPQREQGDELRAASPPPGPGRPERGRGRALRRRRSRSPTRSSCARRSRGRARLGLAACALMLASPWLVVWYVVWAVPLAAAEDDRTAQLVSLALCAYLLPQTVPI